MTTFLRTGTTPMPHGVKALTPEQLAAHARFVATLVAENEARGVPECLCGGGKVVSVAGCETCTQLNAEAWEASAPTRAQRR